MPVPILGSKVMSDNQKVKFLTIFGRPKTGIFRRFRGVPGGPKTLDMDTLAARRSPTHLFYCIVEHRCPAVSPDKPKPLDIVGYRSISSAIARYRQIPHLPDLINPDSLGETPGGVPLGNPPGGSLPPRSPGGAHRGSPRGSPRAIPPGNAPSGSPPSDPRGTYR